MGRRRALAVLLSITALVGLYACVGDSPTVVTGDDAGADASTALDGTVASDTFVPATDAGIDAPAVDGACLIDATGSVASEFSFGFAGDITDVALDSQSNRIEVGGFSGTVTFGIDGGDASTSQGPEDGYVVKRGSGATAAWYQTFGGLNNDMAVSVAVDSNDDVYVAGSTFSVSLLIAGNTYPNPNGGGTQMGFVTKLHGTDGSLVWTQLFSLTAGAPASGAARCVQIAANESYIALGCHFANAPLAFNGPDAAAEQMTDYPGGNVALFTLDPTTGNVITQTQIGALDAGSTIDAGEINLQGLDITNKGFAIASGAFTAPWIKDKALDINITRQSQSDGWLTELNTTGKADWQKDFASDGGTTFLTTHTDGTGNALVIGDFNGAANFGNAQLAYVGGNDVYVANVPGGSTGGGKPTWEKVIGGPGDDHGVAITYDSCERPIAIAQVTGDLTIDGFAFPQQQPGGAPVSATMKFTTGGTLLWAHGPAPTAGNTLTPTSLVGYSGGNTIMVGSFLGTVDLGNSYVPTSSGTNAFEIFFSR